MLRWAGAPALECQQGERAFQPIDGVCYFAVDLQATGSVTVERRTATGAEQRELKVGPYPYSTQSIRGVESKFVAPSQEQQERIRSEAADVAKLWELSTPRRFELPLGPPLRSLSKAGRFGSRRIVNGEPRSPHGGNDYSAATGTPVLAPADGTVALTGDQFYAGRAVYLDHGDGLISMSFHLSQILVKQGETVKRGQVIGKSGATGLVTGPHLHFGLRWRGARIDPALLLGRPEAIPALGVRPTGATRKAPASRPAGPGGARP